MKLHNLQLDELLGTAAAAEFLGVSPHSIRRWAREGKIRHILTPSGRMFFDPADLAEAVAIRGKNFGAAAGSGSSRDTPLPGLGGTR